MKKFTKFNLLNFNTPHRWNICCKTIFFYLESCGYRAISFYFCVVKIK